MSYNLAPIEEEKEPAHNNADSQAASSQNYKAERAPVFQASSLAEFMQIAFDIRRLPSKEDAASHYFSISSQEHTSSFGAKILVAGNDITMSNFVQEYARTATSFTETKNTHFKRSCQVYLLPTGYNSVSSFLASREPLYRQNIFQFFSGMNKEYSKLVKPKGVIQERSIESDHLEHLKRLYENVV